MAVFRPGDTVRVLLCRDYPAREPVLRVPGVVERKLRGRRLWMVRTLDGYLRYVPEGHIELEDSDNLLSAGEEQA